MSPKSTWTRHCGKAAFHKLYSTITSLINSTDSWYSTVDRREVNFAIYLDLKKAFDTVDHTILLAKLEKYGLRGITGDWPTSYLQNRKQFCTVGGHRSSAKMVTRGIPQGSCLDPLLFIIYLKFAWNYRKPTYMVMTHMLP